MNCSPGTIPLNYAYIAMIIFLLLSSTMVVGTSDTSTSSGGNTGYLPLSDLKDVKAYVFKVAPADATYANIILSKGGCGSQNNWDSYYNRFNDRVIYTTLKTDSYAGVFKITDKGHVYYDLMHNRRFPPLYNDTNRDIDLIRGLLGKVIEIADNVSIKYTGVSGTLIEASWGYDIHFDFEKGKWVSTEIPLKVNITNPWNTYIVWIGNFSWPYKISVRWGVFDGKVKLVHLGGLFPRVVDGSSFIISDELLQRILSAYNDAILRDKQSFRNVSGVYVDDVNDLAVVRMYYDVFRVHDSYYLVPTLWVIPKSFINKPITGFYVLIHVFPDTVYGETTIIAGGLSGSRIGGEVPRSLFASKDPFESARSNRSFEDYMKIMSIMLPSIIIGVLLIDKLRNKAKQ